MNSPEETDVRLFTINTETGLGPLPVRRHGMGQGGYRKEPVLESLGNYLKQTEKTVIRLFVQEYYGVYPEHDTYDWSALDRAVQSIRDCGAEPLMCLCLKPRVLYPSIDQTIVHPNDYDEWQRFIEALVRHYNKELGWKITYWEIFNEPDIGEMGGCPGLFQPEDYCRYYEMTVEAILRADPHVKVGGPALASRTHPILPRFLDYCVNKGLRVDFVSWHIYTASPEEMANSIRDVKTLLEQYPQIHCETILDEWSLPEWGEIGDRANALLKDYPTLRSAHMLAMFHVFCRYGLDRSNYYHIKEMLIVREQFASWFSPEGLDFQERVFTSEHNWGLFDLNNRPRPHYYAYQWFQSLKGEWLVSDGGGISEDVNLFAVKQGGKVVILLWNYDFDSPKKLNVKIRLNGLEHSPKTAVMMALDNATVDQVLAGNTPSQEIEICEDGGCPSIAIPVLPFGVYLITCPLRENQ